MVSLEFFLNKFFALFPECLGCLGIERISANALADRRNDIIVRDDFAHMAVLAVLAADFISGRYDGSPHGGGCSLGNCLEFKRAFTLGGELFVNVIYQRLKLIGSHVPSQFGFDSTGMDRSRANSTPAMARIERDRKEDVSRLGSAIGNKGFVRRLFKAGIFQIHIGEAMSGRSEINQASSVVDQGRNLVHEDEVAQVIGSKLGFESIRRMTKRSGHDAGIGNDHVEAFAFGQQAVGGGTHALQAGKIQFDELKGATMSGCCLLHLVCGTLGFSQIPCSTGDMGSMSHESSRGLHTQTCGNSSHEDTLAFEIHSGKNFVGG